MKNFIARFLFCGTLIATLSHPCCAQTTLELRLTPTLSVTGAVGSLQQVQFSDSLAPPTNWSALANLRLLSSPSFYTDVTSQSPHRFYRTLTLTNAADTNLMWIPPGTFLMGSPSNEVGRADNEGPQTWVTLTRGFFIGRFEVTQLEWVSVMGGLPGTQSVTNDNLAVQHVSSFAASNYCAQLTARDLAAFRIPPGWAYRLPTEAEWEYCCRAGSTTVFHFGNAIYNNTNLGSLANFDGRSPYPPIPTNDPAGIYLPQPARVGTYISNSFGLFDMHGNVEEWCVDGTDLVLLPYSGGSVTNPVSSGLFKVVRGGFYSSTGALCRSATRKLGGPPSTATTGLRVVLVPAGT